MNDQVESSDLLGQRQQRIDKLNTLKKLKVSPYPSTTRRDTEISKINSDFESFNGKNVVVAGRIKNIRSHGKLKFMDLMDDSGKIQIYIRFDGLSTTELKETRSLSFEELDLLDVSDFIEVS
jgi:lysyl-tRNA synthetase class 2